MSQFDWPITQKKNETMEAPKYKRFYFEVYLGERRTTFAKAYGIKVEVLLGTLWGTCHEWELFALIPPNPNYIPKIGCHYFWLGPIALLKNTQSILGNLFFWGTYFCFILIS
jgi:hypothetical protein